MKEVTKQQQPAVSGGEFPPEGCIPGPYKIPPWPEVDFPPLPTVPGPPDVGIVDA